MAGLAAAEVHVGVARGVAGQGARPVRPRGGRAAPLGRLTAHINVTSEELYSKYAIIIVYTEYLNKNVHILS